MNINAFAEISANHSGTFNMPTGSALAPGRLPVRFAGLCRLPKCKIHGVFFYIANHYSCSGFKFFKRLVGKLAVFVKGFGAEINIAVNLIGMTVVNKSLNNFDNLINIFSCLGMNRSGSEIQAFGIFPKLFDILFGNLGKGRAFLIGTLYNFIVNIGKILNKGNFISPVFKISS